MSEPSKQPVDAAGDPWQEVGWDTHRKAQLKRWAAIPLAQKLEWLEAAQQMSLQLKRAREAGPSQAQS